MIPPASVIAQTERFQFWAERNSDEAADDHGDHPERTHARTAICRSADVVRVARQLQERADDLDGARVSRRAA